MLSFVLGLRAVTRRRKNCLGAATALGNQAIALRSCHGANAVCYPLTDGKPASLEESTTDLARPEPLDRFILGSCDCREKHSIYADAGVVFSG